MAAELHSHYGRIRLVTAAFISLLAMVSIFISGLPTAGKVVLALAVALATYRCLADRSTHTIKLDRRAGSSLDGLRGNLIGEAVTGLFVALRLVAPDGRTHRAFLFCDELQADQFRMLLAYLRHG